MQKLKILIIFLSLFSIGLQPALVSAQTNPDNTCLPGEPAVECMRRFAERTGVAADLTDVDKPFPEIVGSIIKGLLGFLGVVFLLLILYGGVLWMTSLGNEERISRAKKILANSAIGLFIIIISFALTTFIFDVILGATGTNP